MEKIRDIAKEEERKGARTWVGYKKSRINDKWWIWDEEEEILRNRKEGEIRRRKKKKKERKRDFGKAKGRRKVEK